MGFDYRVNMFDKFKMTKDEKDFVANVDASGGMNATGPEVHNILATFYLAKQIENMNISSDRSSKRMSWLTLALVTVGAVQALTSYFIFKLQAAVFLSIPK